MLGSVVEHDEHPCPGAAPPRGQRARKPCRGTVELAPGEAPIGLDHGRCVPQDIGDGGDERSEAAVHRLSIAAGPGSSRAQVHKRDDRRMSVHTSELAGFAVAGVAVVAAGGAWVASIRSARAARDIGRLLQDDKARLEAGHRGTETSRLASTPSVATPSIPPVPDSGVRASTPTSSEVRFARPAPVIEAALGVPEPWAATTQPTVIDAVGLRRWLDIFEPSDEPLTVFSVDLDDLAAMQERADPVDTDLVLDTVEQRLRSVVRPGDVVADVERGRFVIVCRAMGTPERAEALAERIGLVVSHPALIDSDVVEVTASIGVALGNSPQERPEPIVRRAVAACARARSRGNGQIEVGTIVDVLSQRPARDDELAGALARNELRVHYLPMVQIDSGRVVGFEALLRWEHPTRGLLFPLTFLTDAERTGLIVPIGVWLIEEACRQLGTWRAHAPNLSLSVNLSARQLVDARFVAQVERIVRDGVLPPEALWFEANEQGVRGGGEDARASLRRVHEMGARVVLDDLDGTEPVLAGMGHLPLHAVKIDRGVVAGLGMGGPADAACQAVVELAHSLALCVVAEGVETLPQLNALRVAGCELGQGHLFGAARSARDFGDVPPGFLGQVGGAPDPG